MICDNCNEEFEPISIGDSTLKYEIKTTENIKLPSLCIHCAIMKTNKKLSKISKECMNCKKRFLFYNKNLSDYMNLNDIDIKDMNLPVFQDWCCHECFDGGEYTKHGKYLRLLAFVKSISEIKIASLVDSEIIGQCCLLINQAKEIIMDMGEHYV